MSGCLGTSVEIYVKQGEVWVPIPSIPVVPRDTHDAIRVTLRDTATGATAIVDTISLWQWTEGNWSCDCNREDYFEYDTEDDDDDGTPDGKEFVWTEVPCVSERHIVIAAERLDGQPIDMTEFDFNPGYPSPLFNSPPAGP